MIAKYHNLNNSLQTAKYVSDVNVKRVTKYCEVKEYNKC